MGPPLSSVGVGKRSCEIDYEPQEEPTKEVTDAGDHHPNSHAGADR